MLAPRATNYNSHVTLSTHNKSSETELKYSEGLQGVSSRENQGKVCLFPVQGEEGREQCDVFMCQCMWRGVWRERWVAQGQAAEGVRKIGSKPMLCLPTLPPSLHTSGVACLARRHGCLLGWRRVGVAEFLGGGGGHLSDICSAETRGRRAIGTGGRSVESIGTRLAPAAGGGWP